MLTSVASAHMRLKPGWDTVLENCAFPVCSSRSLKGRGFFNHFCTTHPPRRALAMTSLWTTSVKTIVVDSFLTLPLIGSVALGKSLTHWFLTVLSTNSVSTGNTPVKFSGSNPANAKSFLKTRWICFSIYPFGRGAVILTSLVNVLWWLINACKAIEDLLLHRWEILCNCQVLLILLFYLLSC